MMAKIKSAIHLLETVARHPSNQGRTGNAIAAVGRTVWWQTKARAGEPVLFDWIGDAKLVAERGMSGATGNIYNGLDEFADMSFLLHLLRPDDLFFDIGANIGSYTILASAVCKANCVSVEPDPDTMSDFQRNIDANNISDLVAPQQLALAEAPGELNFTIGLTSTNHVTAEEGHDTQKVMASTLDLMSEEHGVPLLIKMDVEGGEESALTGGAKTLADPALKAVIIEDQSDAVLNLLTAAGLRQVWYDVANRCVSDHPTPGSFNALFVRHPDEINPRLAQAPKHRFRGTTF